jgi:hypothetical protein
MAAMAVRLAQLRTKVAQAADFASKHGGAYYKEAMVPKRPSPDPAARYLPLAATVLPRCSVQPDFATPLVSFLSRFLAFISGESVWIRMICCLV